MQNFNKIPSNSNPIQKCTKHNGLVKDVFFEAKAFSRSKTAKKKFQKPRSPIFLGRRVIHCTSSARKFEHIRSYTEVHVSFVGFSSFSKSILSISACKSNSLLTSIHTNGLVTSQSTFRRKRGPSAVLEILIT